LAQVGPIVVVEAVVVVAVVAVVEVGWA